METTIDQVIFQLAKGVEVLDKCNITKKSLKIEYRLKEAEYRRIHSIVSKENNNFGRIPDNHFKVYFSGAEIVFIKDEN